MSCAVTETIALIQRRLSERIGPQRYGIWFKNTTTFSLTDSLVSIGVPNHFVGTWIQNHFSESIVEAAKEVTGREVQLTFAIDPQLHALLRKSQLNKQAESVAKQSVPAGRSARRTDYVPPPRALRGRLEDFVVGRSNQLAYTGALSIVEATVPQFNPLFIYGGCGLGKTHLLQGVCNALRDRRSQRRWRYVSGEEFTNHFLSGLQTGGLNAFRGQFRSLDVLVIDDVHFLANKKATQEEFLHTYNAIDAAGKQVVLASDAHPKLMGQLPENLVSRFVCGMVVRIDPPDRDTRCEILRRRAAKLNCQIPEEVIGYIADNLHANVRELEGGLLKLLAFASFMHEPITVAMARRALADYLPQADRLVTASDIESIVSTFFGLTPAELHSSRKTQTIALARAVAMYLARRRTSMSFPEIGRVMGKKNHSTVILACRKIERTLVENAAVTWQNGDGRQEMPLRTLLEQLEEQLGSDPPLPHRETLVAGGTAGRPCPGT